MKFVMKIFRAGNNAAQALGSVFGDDADHRLQVAVRKLHALGTELSVVGNQTFNKLHIVVVAVNDHAVLVEVNLDVQEGLEILYVPVVCSEEFNDSIADSDAFLHAT